MARSARHGIPPLTALLTALAALSAHAGSWQQEVRYTIDVTLDPAAHDLNGTERLLYTNHSPDTLRDVWFHAYPNAFRDEHTVFARESIAAGEHPGLFSNRDENGWIDFGTVRYEGRPVDWTYKEDDATEIHMRLPAPLPPGAAGEFDIPFTVRIPIIFSRLGRSGDHYEVTQWYPKIAVFDEEGWHPDGYHRDGEFYGDFGTFDVTITLPADYTVASTGLLVGPPSEIARCDSLARLGGSPSGPRRPPPPETRTKTIHIVAERVHDFAWFADRRYRILRDHVGPTEIDAYVLPRDLDDWADVPKWVAGAIAWYSRLYGPYPYARMSVAEGDNAGSSGMEYPNVIAIEMPWIPFSRLLENVIVHETGHQWFYGILGSNEMSEAWMDEGITTYATTRYFEEKYGRSKNLVKWPRGWGWLPGPDARWTLLYSYHTLADVDWDGPILQPAWRFGRTYYGVVYAKTALALFSLQESLGDSLFDRIMATYARKWKFRHPHTRDFVAIADSVSGKNLDRLFDDLLTTTKRCDYALGSVRTAPAPSGTGWRTSVEIRRDGAVSLPGIPVRLVTRDGEIVDGSAGGDSARDTLLFETSSRPRSIGIDPDDNILEIDHMNDRRPLAHRWILGPAEPSYSKLDTIFLPYVLYKDDTDGMQIGAWSQTGNPFVQAPLGRILLYDATRSGRLGYAGSLRTRVPFDHRRGFITASAKDEQGYAQQRISMDVWFRDRIDSHRSTDFSLSAFGNELYSRAAFEPEDWQTGRMAGAEGSIGWTIDSWRGRIDEGLRFRAVFGDYRYEKIEETIRGSLALGPRTSIGARLYAGAIRGGPPLQDRIYLAGDLDPDRKVPWVLDRRGSGLVPLRKLFIQGGPAVRGYSGAFRPGADPAGRSGAGIGFFYRAGTKAAGTSLFYDLGDVWNDWRSARARDLESDAGLEIDLGPLIFSSPFWLSDPGEGERHLRMRWMLGVSIPGLPPVLE